jgi:hypothetical protein
MTYELPEFGDRFPSDDGLRNGDSFICGGLWLLMLLDVRAADMTEDIVLLEGAIVAYALEVACCSITGGARAAVTGGAATAVVIVLVVGCCWWWLWICVQLYQILVGKRNSSRRISVGSSRLRQRGGERRFL